jgi:hypothetical protein
VDAHEVRELVHDEQTVSDVRRFRWPAADQRVRDPAAVLHLQDEVSAATGLTDAEIVALRATLRALTANLRHSASR